MNDAIVRTLWKHRESGRNVLANVSLISVYLLANITTNRTIRPELPVIK